MCEDRGVDWLSEEEYNRLKEKTMSNKKKTKARKGKQFGGGINQPLGGGINQPLGGVRAPIRPVGFKRGKTAKKK